MAKSGNWAKIAPISAKTSRISGQAFRGYSESQFPAGLSFSGDTLPQKRGNGSRNGVGIPPRRASRESCSQAFHLILGGMRWVCGLQMGPRTGSSHIISSTCGVVSHTIHGVISHTIHLAACDLLGVLNLLFLGWPAFRRHVRRYRTAPRKHAHTSRVGFEDYFSTNAVIASKHRQQPYTLNSQPGRASALWQWCRKDRARVDRSNPGECI